MRVELRGTMRARVYARQAPLNACVAGLQAVALEAMSSANDKDRRYLKKHEGEVGRGWAERWIGSHGCLADSIVR